jgi:hypothetical protein
MDEDKFTEGTYIIVASTAHNGRGYEEACRRSDADSICIDIFKDTPCWYVYY